MPQSFNFKSAIFVAAILFSVFHQANAGQVHSLYDVDTLVVDESSGVRAVAFKQGLEEVFIRISGDSIVMSKLKRPASSRYVKQFSYLPVETSVTEQVVNKGGKTLTHRLKIQYNGNLMEKYLLDNGFPVWGEHRQDVVVWLAVRDGQNEYVLKDFDQSLLKVAVDEALTRRGVPERWPLYDYKDRKVLKIVDIRGGFKEQLISASKRYAKGPVLAGSMIWNGEQWQSNWSLLMASSDQYWSLVDADYRQLLNHAINRAADVMGAKYAINNVTKNKRLARIHLDIQSVNTIEKYRHVENYLTELNAVDMVRPLSVDGQSVVFEVKLRSNEDDFLSLIKNDAELVEVKINEVQKQAQPLLLPENGQLPKLQEADTLMVDVEGALVERLAAVETEENMAFSSRQQSQLPVYHYRLIN